MARPPAAVPRYRPSPWVGRNQKHVDAVGARSAARSRLRLLHGVGDLDRGRDQAELEEHVGDLLLRGDHVRRDRLHAVARAARPRPRGRPPECRAPARTAPRHRRVGVDPGVDLAERGDDGVDGVGVACRRSRARRDRIRGCRPRPLPLASWRAPVAASAAARNGSQITQASTERHGKPASRFVELVKAALALIGEKRSASAINSAIKRHGQK